MARRRALPVLKPVDILGVSYAISTARSPEDLAAIEGLEGWFDPTAARILVNGNLAPARLWDVLKHEIAHGAFFATRIDDAIRKRFGLNAKQTIELEELICDQFVPVFTEALERNGWLTPIEIPGVTRG